MEFTACDVLKKAKEIIATEDKWCKHNAAQNVDGNKVAYTNDAACRFCSIGALWKATFDLGSSAVNLNTSIDALDKAVGIDNAGIVGFNDRSDTKLEDVHRVFDKALAALECQS